MALNHDLLNQARAALGMRKLAEAEQTEDKPDSKGPAAKLKDQATQEPIYSPRELRSFARYGLDPQRLRFMQTLSGLMQGLRIQDEMLQRAMRGIGQRTAAPIVAEEPSYGEYA